MTTHPANPSPIKGLSSDAFSSLFQAVGALRNRRALIAMLSCLVAGVLLVGLLTVLLGGGIGGFLLAGLVFVAAAGTGVNAAGLLLMDQAKGVPSRGLVDALVYGLLCIPKVIALALMLLGVALLVFLALALLFFLCKIPGLGPLLFVVVFPLSVLVAGLTLTGLFVCMLLSLPAVWEGAGIMRAIAQTLAVVRARLVETLLLLFGVGFLSITVGFMVFGVLASGLLPSIGMSASILGAGVGGMGLGSVMGLGSGMASGMGDLASGGGYAIAGGLGTGLLWALSATLVGQVYLLGLCLVYLRVTEGLDVGSTEQALTQGLDQARRHAADLSQRAREAADRAREQARQRSAATAPANGQPLAADSPPRAAIPAAVACPACRAPATADDTFCGVCGHKLR